MAVSPKIRDVPPVYGLEASLRATPTNRLLLSATYGYTHATFQEYNDGKNDYKNNFVPFAPAHTLALSGAYTLPLDKETDLTFDLQYLGRGKIYWTEANDAAQKLLWAGKCIDYPFGEICRFETMGEKSAESTLSGVLLRDHECRELVYAQQLRTVRPPDYIRRRYHH